MTATGRCKSSRYNFHVPVDGGAILYNALSGAAISFEGRDSTALCEALSGAVREIASEAFHDRTFDRLRRGGFLLDPDEDELAIVRDRYRHARGDTPIVLTLTTTQDCNLGCYYCYESRTKHALSADDVPRIVALAKDRLETSGKRSLHVDWYGGEPLMNLEFLDQASRALQEMCAEHGISYMASVISNGTCWPGDVAGFVKRHRIRQVQISFDGLKNNHDKRRRYRRGYKPAPDTSSFDQAVELVDKLVHHVRLDLRLNIDRGNQGDLEPFIEFCTKRHWFETPYRVELQLARLSNYSERSAFMRDAELSIEEFEAIRNRARSHIPGESLLDEASSTEAYPHPRTSVCAALARDSLVVGAEGHTYRCGLQVGEGQRAVGLRGPDDTLSEGPDLAWWDSFDPTALPNCSACSFLPLCWGGCPKKHLEGDEHALEEQSMLWRTTLAAKIAHRLGVGLSGEFAFTERDQFRDRQHDGG